MAEAFRQARLEAQRQGAKTRLREHLQAARRARLHDITKRVIRDTGVRDWAIGELVEEGIVGIEVEYTTGRPRTWLVLKE